MGELTKEEGRRVPRARAFGRGPGGIEGLGQEEGEGAGLAARAHSAAARSGLDHGRHGGGRRHVSGGGSPGRLAWLEGWARRGAWRGCAAHVAETPGRAEGGGDRGDGLRAATAGSGGVDVDADRRGGGSPKDRRHDGPRDDPQDAESPRAEAVAGKKCGASRRWMRSTGTRWRTCWISLPDRRKR